MQLKKFVPILLFCFMNTMSAEPISNWSIDAGLRYFKYSSENGPNEIQYNPVFSRWENINQSPSSFTVSEYKPLEPLYFNMNFGIDLFIRYKKNLLIKLGYDYSDPFGIGGKGNISYTNLSNGKSYVEKKEFSYTSHQFNYFIGPIINVGPNNSEVYIAFSPMSPTWVNYTEKYSETENGASIQNYDKTFTGFHGNCRALVGIQIPITHKIKLGSEAVFSFLNYMSLESGDLKDYSFRFPFMKWDFTLRYTLK